MARVGSEVRVSAIFKKNPCRILCPAVGKGGLRPRGGSSVGVRSGKRRLGRMGRCEIYCCITLQSARKKPSRPPS